LGEPEPRLLQRAADRAASHGVEVQTRLLKNLAARTSDLIVAEAVSWRADLIVIGTHGRHGVDRLMQGSTAEDVLRRSPMPVLLVRAASHGAQAVPARPALEPAEAGAP
jgi:nucleotide-binding universal stress UspA family protein